MIKRYLPLLLLLLGVSPCALGQFNQTINVEGKYVPEVVDHDPLALFPTPLRLSVGADELEYDSRGVTVDFTPQAVPMGATGWRTDPVCSPRRGYAGLGLGSWLNASAEAGYRFLDTPDGVAGVRLNYTSTSLWQPKQRKGTEDVRQWRYDGSLGGYYAGRPAGADGGLLEASADCHLGWFDYYGYAPSGTATVRREDVPDQSLTDVVARVAWTSPDAGRLRWNVYGGYRYFGFGKSYDLTRALRREAGEGENRISLGGMLAGHFGERSRVSLDIAGDGFLFRSIEGRVSPYGGVALTPAYTYRSKTLTVGVGARVDLIFNGRYGAFIPMDGAVEGPVTGERFNTFHIAPDVRVEYASGPFGAKLLLGGGTEYNTLAGNYLIDYYTAPTIPATAPAYSPLDGTLALMAGPFSGFTASVEGRWKVTRNLPLLGYYMAALSGASLSGDGWRAVGLDRCRYTDVSGYSAALRLGYEAGRLFGIDVSGTYQTQDSKLSYFNGLDRPEWTVGAVVRSNPWGRLSFRVGFEYRGDRRIFLPAIAGGAERVEGYRLADLPLLSAKVAYGITDYFNVWVSGENLLNRRDELLPYAPLQGIVLSGGLSIAF